MALETVNMPKYATVLNGGVGVLSAASAGAINADTNGVVCYTAGAYGGIIESLIVSSTDTAAVNLIVYMLDGATVHHLAVVNVPIASGTNGTAANVDILNAIQGLPVNSQFKKYIPLRANMTLKVAVLAAMTANKILIAKTTGVDFIA